MNPPSLTGESGSKTCSRCGLELSPEGFYIITKANGQRRAAHCKTCNSQKYKAMYDQDPGKYKAKSRERRDSLRAQVIAGYGSRCSCCGETEPTFLALDHVAGNGNVERRRGVKDCVLFLRVIQGGFPAEYQLLCCNCNWGKHVKGVCPHVLASTRKEAA